MKRKDTGLGGRSRIAVLAVATLTVLAVTAAPALGLSGKLSLTNWSVWGSLTPKKLGEPVVLPKGSTFNGEADIENATGTEIQATLKGHIHVPPFESTVKLAGLVPTTVGVSLTEVGESQGTITTAPPGACRGAKFGGPCAAMHVVAKTDIGLTAAGFEGIEVPTECVTDEPVTLDLSEVGSLVELLEGGLRFTGTTTIPSITCSGLSGVALGPALTAVMSGPENPYELKLAEHEPAPPTVATDSAEVSKTSATLNATVDYNDETQTACEFEYGTSTSYGSTAPCTSGVESGFSVFAMLTGLQEGTTYHFRIVASNTLGTSRGADETFKTRRKRKG